MGKKAATRTWKTHHLLAIDGSRLNFSDLYHQRRGIETRYNDIKGKLQIENFTGNTPIAVKQDFFATLYLANLAGVIAIDYRDEIEAIHNIPENIHKYKMNVNLTISQLKQNVISLPGYIYNTFLSVFPSPKRQKKVTVQPMGIIAGWRRRRTARQNDENE